MRARASSRRHAHPLLVPSRLSPPSHTGASLGPSRPSTFALWISSDTITLSCPRPPFVILVVTVVPSCLAASCSRHSSRRIATASSARRPHTVESATLWRHAVASAVDYCLRPSSASSLLSLLFIFLLAWNTPRCARISLSLSLSLPFLQYPSSCLSIA